jgi:hypothetical protein
MVILYSRLDLAIQTNGVCQPQRSEASILRFLVTHPIGLSHARAEIALAEVAKLISAPIQFEQAQRHLPSSAIVLKKSFA